MQNSRSNDPVDFWRSISKIAPSWVVGRERLADALLGHGEYTQGIDEWRKVLAMQPAPAVENFIDQHVQNYYYNDINWNGEPKDRYSELYKRSVQLLHAGQFDAHLDILKVGVEARESFATRHQLDRLGIKFLREWSYAIGHMALLDMYTKMGILGLRADHLPVVLDSKPANKHYLTYWQEYFPAIITDPEAVKKLTPLAERLEEHLHLVTFKDATRKYCIDAHCHIEALWQQSARKPLLKLRDDDLQFGEDVLQKLGVPKNAWIVGFHVRDTGGANNRDSKLEAYEMAIRTIADHGGWTIRMGDKSMPKAAHLPNFIDYVHTDFHSARMDVYLWGKSRFFLGTNSGPAMVPPTFGVPCIVTNICPAITPLAFPQHTGIYKLYWSNKSKQYLTFAEAFSSSFELSEDRNLWAAQGVEIHDNTNQEINDAVCEMLAKLDGSRTDNEEDKNRVEKFKGLSFGSRYRIGKSNGRISSSFARRHQQLI